MPRLPHTPNSSPSRPWLTRRVVQSDDRDAPLSQVAPEPRQCRSPTYSPQSTVHPPAISPHPVSSNAHRLASLLNDALHDTRSTSAPPAESKRGSSDSQAGINIMRESSPPPKTFKELSQWLRDADPNMMVLSLLLEIAVGRYTQFGLGLKPI
ncbi:hypothetical protein C8Q76DRAFT_803866 [Earliella scabrosa]|nr:hypothetical protein C8Q76DRAFT_803866 [Earliella scabrosa]